MSGPQASVFFVGAGPGPLDLLTLRAVHVLHEADLLAYDELIEPELLQLTQPHCELLAIGYRAQSTAGRHPILHPRILEAARAGFKVVRLKSGDPLIFGRLAEEMAMLDEAGIAFSIVPGITAALAAAASAAWPLTQKGVAASLRFLTWSVEVGTDPSAETLAVYMPRHSLPQLLQNLREKGWPGSTPAAYIQAACRADESIVLSTLAKLEQTIAERGDERPGICLIGQALGARPQANNKFLTTAIPNEDKRNDERASSGLHGTWQGQDDSSLGPGFSGAWSGS